VDKKYCTHNFKGHEGMVTLVKFHPDRKALRLVSASDDCKIMMWDLRKNACVAKVKDHYSAPTAVAFAVTEGGDWFMFSAGRDQVIHVYSLDGTTVSLVNTTPAFEVLEGLEVIGVKGNSVSFATVGVRGQLRIWTCQSVASGCKVHVSRETTTGHLLGAPVGELSLRFVRRFGVSFLYGVAPACAGSELAPEALEAPVSQQVTSLLHARDSDTIVCVTADHTLLFVDVATLALNKTLIGNNDDVIDVKYIPSPELDGTTSSRIAVATNSEQLRLFDVNTFDCSVLAGHSESILSVDVSPDGQFIATASKDKTARSGVSRV
jgi:U3 small nucleolar RNA-associated protein 13